MTPALDENSRKLDVDRADLKAIRARHREELGLKMVSGAAVSIASFITSYLLTRETMWAEDAGDVYPYCAVMLAARPRLLGTGVMLLVIGTLSAVAGAAAAALFGEPEPASALRYGVWTRVE